MSGIQKAALLLVGMVACHPGVSGGPAPLSTAPMVTVRQVLTTQALVGETVVVVGRCLGSEASTVATGSRPISTHAWQIEDHGVAAWVTGPKPEGCDENSTVAGVITARVAQDTLPRFSRARSVRQYLVMR